MSTTAHSLQLVAGPLRVTVTEAEHAVYIGMTGPKPLGFEQRKLKAFLFTLVDAFRNDPRRLEINGNRADYTGCIDPVREVGWVGYARRVEASQ